MLEYKGYTELNQFISNNLNVKFMAITVSENEPFGIILKDYLFKLPNLSYEFKRQFSNEIKGLTTEQLYSIKIDVTSYLESINKYIKWYNLNKKTTSKHFNKPNLNPYEIVYNELYLIKIFILKYIPSQQKETNKTEEINEELHNNMFRGNSFLLFKKYVEMKNVLNNSRTDFRFLYDIMKKDNFIYETVTLKQYITFINTHFDYVDSELKSISLSSSPNIKRRKDYQQYKDNIKPTLK